MNDDKIGFANALAETGSHAFLGMSECERYGMTWGCDEDCPVYQRGECKNEVTLAQLGDNRENKGYDKE